MRRGVVDGAIAIVLALTAGVAGTRYVRAVIDGGGRPEYYQNEFGPAVSVACGHGYVNPDASALPMLREFLESRIDQFDCAALPAAAPSLPLTGPQLTWKYLLGVSALIWRLTGHVSWRGLIPLSGAFFGITVALTYAGLRLIAGRLASTLGAIAMMTSPMHLRELPHLRDYSKAPFMIAVGVVLAVLAARRLSTRALLAWAAVYGLVLGVGAGFRNDLLITIPAFAVAATVGACRADRGRLVRLIAAPMVAAVTFLFAAAPVLGAYGTGGGASMGHVALLGLATPFNQPLGVAPSPAYGFIPIYNDSFVAAIISDYAVRMQGSRGPIRVYDRTYDAASGGVVRAVLATMPADLWVRGLGSLIEIAELPASNFADLEPPPYVSSSWIQRGFEWRARLLRGRQTTMFWTVILAFVIAAAIAPTTAFAIFVMTAYIAAYPAIQFHERHYFHLNILSIAAAVFLAARAWDGLRALRPGAVRPQWKQAGAAVRNVAGFVVAAGLVLAGPLWPLRAYQRTQMSTLLSGYEHAAVAPIGFTERTIDGGRLALDAAPLPASAASAAQVGTAQAEYVVAEFTQSACDAAGVSFTIRYDSGDSSTDFSRSIDAQPPLDGAQPLRVFFPVYYATGADLGRGLRRTYAFRGLELPAAQRPCLTALSRLTDLSAFPLLLDARLPPHWETATMFQTLIGFESSHSPAQMTVYGAPSGISVPRQVLSAPLAPLDAAQALASSVTVRSAGSFVVRGRGGIGSVGPFTYLALFPPQPRRAGQRLVAEGELRSGGLSLGVLSRGLWMAQAVVVTPGRFIVVVELPQDAPDGQVVVANNLHGWSLDNEFEIMRIGWQQ